MISNEIERHKTDVVIVGSEGAGATAVIELAKRNLSSIVITKGNGLGRSGATITGEADLAVDSRSLHERFKMENCAPEDSKDKFFEDIILGGKYISQQDIVEAHVNDAPERLQDLIDWGLKPLFVTKMSGHSYPRGVIVSAPEMIKIYREQVKKTGTTLLANIMVQDLLFTDGRCCGVFGVNLKTGNFITIEAKATILATGGGMRIYPVTTGPEELTGDGTAMALRAGVELMDMEFPMFLPGTFPWPKAVKGVNTPFKLSSAGMVHGYLYNKHGDRFMAKWDPVKMERSTRDILAVGIWTEIMEGRGGPHGGVFVSLSHLPENLIDYIMEWLPPKYLKRYGGFDMKNFLPDLKKYAVESIPACHFFNGGIRIDKECHTNLPGLYAAGEVAAGIHGGNRLSGNAFTDMIVWGHRAAVSIASDLSKESISTAIDSAQEESYIGEALQGFDSSSGENPQELRDNLMESAWKNVGIVRNKEGLSEAKETIKDLKRKYKDIVLTCKDKVYNREWLRALELLNMIDNLDCMVETASNRNESRAAHYRKDCPDTNHADWAVNQVVVRKDNILQITKVKPTITRMQPPSKVEKYGT